MLKKVNFRPYLFSLLKLYLFWNKDKFNSKRRNRKLGEIDVFSVTFPNSLTLCRGTVASYVCILCSHHLERPSNVFMSTPDCRPRKLHCQLSMIPHSSRLQEYILDLYLLSNVDTAFLLTLC